MSTPNSKLHVLSHPILNAKMAILRQANTSAKDFRGEIEAISYILGIEASRDLEEEPFHGVSQASYTYSYLLLNVQSAL